MVSYDFIAWGAFIWRSSPRRSPRVYTTGDRRSDNRQLVARLHRCSSPQRSPVVYTRGDCHDRRDNRLVCTLQAIVAAMIGPTVAATIAPCIRPITFLHWSSSLKLYPVSYCICLPHCFTMGSFSMYLCVIWLHRCYNCYFFVAFFPIFCYFLLFFIIYTSLLKLILVSCRIYLPRCFSVASVSV